MQEANPEAGNLDSEMSYSSFDSKEEVDHNSDVNYEPSQVELAFRHQTYVL